MDQTLFRRKLALVRVWLTLFIVGLVLSGVTAFPLEHETRWLAQFVTRHQIFPPAMVAWTVRVSEAVHEQSVRNRFLAYGTDWLAFGHLALAVMFLGPLWNPVRNKWVLYAGLIACAGVLLLALIAGPIRGIPFVWRLIDCSFGVFGAIPLAFALRHTLSLERLESEPQIVQAM